MALPSPRTPRQAREDILINAIRLMDDTELDAVYGEIGPYCMEKLLNATGGGKAAAPAFGVKELLDRVASARVAPPVVNGARQRPRRVGAPRLGKSETHDLIQRLKTMLGDDWSLQSIETVLGGRSGSGRTRAAQAIHSMSPEYQMSMKYVKEIEEYL